MNNEEIKNLANELTGNNEKLLELMKELNVPIDFDSLIEAEILEKKGAWYKVLKFEEIPPNIKGRVIEVKQNYKDGKPNEIFFKFSKESKSLDKQIKSLEVRTKNTKRRLSGR